MHKIIATMLSLITAAFCIPQPLLHADHASPLFHATREYRDATQRLSRILTYHATLEPTQQRFLSQLIHSSQQLYAAALFTSRSATIPSANEYQRLWGHIESLIRDLPWMLETLPPHVTQSIRPHYRQFLATFHTLAAQVELRNPAGAVWSGGNGRLPIKYPTQLWMSRTHSVPSHHDYPSENDYPSKNSCPREQNVLDKEPTRGRQAKQLVALPCRLSPSEWQLKTTEPHHRSKNPVRGKEAELGAKLTRLTRFR